MSARARRLGIAAGAVAGIVLAVAAWLGIAARGFRGEFERRAELARAVAGAQDAAPVTDADLRSVPEPIARWIRHAGAVGKPRVSAVRVVHGGAFRTSPGGPWRPIRGEYLITTRRPSFTWYGEVRLAPGVGVAAIDSYLDGRGRMQVKALSAIALVDARSPQTDQSAFGRCVAELTLAPTFFLDQALVRCDRTGPDSARCRVADGRFTADAELSVRPDGSLDRVVVQRWFDRGQGQATLERFTGQAWPPRDHGGRRVPSRIDGTWNLPEGDLHYVAFDIERVSFE